VWVTRRFLVVAPLELLQHRLSEMGHSEDHRPVLHPGCRAIREVLSHTAGPTQSDHLRTYQAYLLRERKLGPRTVKLYVSALRFFFVKTLKRPYMLEAIPFPKVPRRLPAILTTDEVARLIDGARNLTDRTMLMVLYSTGMRNAELRHLQVRDIDRWN
jgi:integrase